MKVLLQKGDKLIVELEDGGDGTFVIEYGMNELCVDVDLPDSDGREGRIYSERFGDVDFDKLVAEQLDEEFGDLTVLESSAERTAHIDWSKERALAFVEKDDLAGAVDSMVKDMMSNTETEDAMVIMKDMVTPALVKGDKEAVRRWIQGFC